MQLERAAQEAHQAQRDLAEQSTEAQTAQAELGKAAQDFRRLHAERAELLEQWEKVVAAVQQRDADILAAGGWVDVAWAGGGVGAHADVRCQAKQVRGALPCLPMMLHCRPGARRAQGQAGGPADGAGRAGGGAGCGRGGR